MKSKPTFQFTITVFFFFHSSEWRWYGDWFPLQKETTTTAKTNKKENSIFFFFGWNINQPNIKCLPINYIKIWCFNDGLNTKLKKKKRTEIDTKMFTCFGRPTVFWKVAGGRALRMLQNTYICCWLFRYNQLTNCIVDTLQFYSFVRSHSPVHWTWHHLRNLLFGFSIFYIGKKINEKKKIQKIAVNSMPIRVFM